MNEDLKKIKKVYGEKMAHLCRELFSTLLEINGLLYSLISSKFAPNKFLYDDLINQEMVNEFKNYIYSLYDIEKKEIKVIKNPFELMKEAGYTLYKCEAKDYYILNYIIINMPKLAKILYKFKRGAI